MGIFANLFRPTSELERQLETEYVPFYETTQGLQHSKAITAVRDLIQATKRQSKHEGTDIPNLGDDLLRRQATDNNVRQMLVQKRREGVTDNDIRWWWNMPDLRRRLLIYHMNIPRLAVLAHALDEGRDKEAAAAKVRKIFPMFGDQSDLNVTSGDDRPLPYELQDRINQYQVRRGSQNVEAYKRDVESSSSFNALIRKEIRNGNL